MTRRRLNKTLNAFSSNLVVPRAVTRQGKKTMTKIFLVLQKKSEYNLDRCRLVGGMGKKTSTVLRFDYDCVIYVNKIDPPFKDLLEEWKNILESHFNNDIGKIQMTRHSLQFEIGEFEFDLLPAPNYTRPNHDTMQQAKTIWRKISLEQDNQLQNTCSLYSSGLSELALAFIKKQSCFIHNLCRLAKYWNQTILNETRIYGRSVTIECLAVQAGRQEQQAAIKRKPSILNAFRYFLNYLIKYQQISIIFSDFYDKSEVSLPAMPYLIDPTNPYNNLLDHMPENFLSSLATYSQETLRRLEKCEMNFIPEIERLFDPQPDLSNFFSSSAKLNYISTMITSEPHCQDKPEQLITNPDTFDLAARKFMQSTIYYVLPYLTTVAKREYKGDTIKGIIRSTEHFLERSLHQIHHPDTSMATKSDEWDITLIFPLNTIDKDGLHISMRQ